MTITKNTKQKINKMVTILKEQKGYVTSEELANRLGFAQKSFLNMISRHKDYLPPNVKGVTGKGYIWVDDPVVVEKKEETKNAEGYSDPTASKAIDNMKKYYYTESEYLPGVVYKVEQFYEDRLVLVISGYPGTINCLEVKDIKDMFYDPDICIVLIGAENYYVDPRRIISVPEKRFKKAKYNVPADCFNNVIKPAIAACLGIDTVEKIVEVPVEKAVEKIVEVPAQAKPQKVTYNGADYPVKALDKEDLKHAEEIASIWKEAFYAVAGKNLTLNVKEER